MILVALSLLGAATVLFVLTPVFRTATGSGADAVAFPDGAVLELQDLEEKKLRLYDAIKDLDFEKAAGKVSGDDYEAARNDYLGQVAEVIARIDALSPEAPKEKAPKGKTKTKPKAKTKTEKGEPATETTRACGACEAQSPASAKFCMACGEALERACASCGTTLPDEAKFCLACGEKVAS